MAVFTMLIGNKQSVMEFIYCDNTMYCLDTFTFNYIGINLRIELLASDRKQQQALKTL